MNVIDLLAYRVIPLDKSDGINVGSVLPIPEERAVFDGNQTKNETEDFFEEIRKELFPHLPSRKSVLFVLPYDKVIADGWVALQTPHNDYDSVLLTLRLTGTLIWCEENKFSDACVLPFFREACAREYWEGASDEFNQFDTPEGLFRGMARVEAITAGHHISPFKG